MYPCHEMFRTVLQTAPSPRATFRWRKSQVNQADSRSIGTFGRKENWLGPLIQLFAHNEIQ